MHRWDKIILVIWTILLISCQDKHVPFNKTGWTESVDAKPCPPLREQMVDDLLSNHLIKGLTYRQIISKLGPSDNHENTKPDILRYEISNEYTNGDIVHITALDFNFTKDSVITSWDIVKFDVDL